METQARVSQIEMAGAGGHAGSDVTTKASTVLDPTKQFGAFSSQVVDLMKAITPLADQKSSTFLMTCGAVALVLSFVGKIKLAGVSIAQLDTAEFIVLVLVGLVLLACGTLLRVYSQLQAARTAQSISDTGARLVERTQVAATRLLEGSQEKGAKLMEDAKPPKFDL